MGGISSSIYCFVVAESLVFCINICIKGPPLEMLQNNETELKTLIIKLKFLQVKK